MAGKLVPTFKEEVRLREQGYARVAGVDEVGRGPLAGPVVAAAVVLDPDAGLPCYDDLRDSKALSAAQRERLARLIQGDALGAATGLATTQEIDEAGIVEATRRAMRRAIRGLPERPDHLLVDALPLPGPGVPFRAITRGDALCRSVAAASIVAKVTRDALMVEADAAHPGYGFARNKGYATPFHLRQLAALGPCPLHRRYYAPVRALVNGETEKHSTLQRTRGLNAEDAASHLLQRKGYVILDRNYRCRWGEIDIIARGRRHLAFVEVKGRRGNTMGTPLEAITPRKQRRLIISAQHYLQQTNLAALPWQIDVIEATLGPRGVVRSLQHLENVVGEQL